MREVNEQFQLVPPHIHQRNSAERAISNFKDNFIAGLSITHKDFPLHLWCQLIPHAILTLNLLQQSHMNPKLSGYAQLHGEFNYNTTPLAPPGTQVIIHEKPTVRGTWASHGVKGWYLGPSMNHYQYHHVYITKTREEQDSDCVEFFLHNTSLPYKSSAENAKNPAPQAPFSNIGEYQLVAIEHLSKIFTKAADDGKSTADPPQQQAEQTAAVIPQTLQSVRTKYITSLQPNAIEDEEGKDPIFFLHKVHSSPSGPQIIPPEVPIPSPRVNTVQPPRVGNGGPSSNLISRCNKNPRPRYALTSQFQKTRGSNSVTHQISGVAQEYRHLIKVPERKIWEISFANKLGQSAQGIR